MKNIRLFFFCVPMFFIYFFFSSGKETYAAAAHVDTAYNVTYTVNEKGMTHAVFQAGLTNETSDYYVSTYSLQVGFTTVENIHASDGLGTVQTDLQKNNNGYLIVLHFNQQVVGLKNVLHFTLSFDTSDVAQKTGHIWEINIPGIGDQNKFTDFNVHVRVPASFGKASFIKPIQTENALDFTKDELGSSGISITFGQQQTYSFDLKYHLENNNLFPIKTEIAIPPTTNYQDVSLENLNPPPTQLILDKDGNWLAQYTLLPSKKLTVDAKGRIFVHLNPQSQSLSDKDKAIFLEQQPYWQTKNEQIQKLAQQLQTPENIYNYVRSHLTYDFSRVSEEQKRLGAAYVVQHPQSAVCLEFTDLFVAIARAAGIPAREIDGFAYTQNTQQRPTSLNDILHAWPEYYDSEKKAWIMVDPTWSNTTGGVDYFHELDFDHVAFTIKGVDSAYPVPAGGYKLAGEENEKDVHISFASDTRLPNPQATIDQQVPSTAIAGFPITATLTVSNSGHTIIPAQDLIVTTTGILPRYQDIAVTAIPPYGSITLPITLSTSSFLTKDNGMVTIQVGSAVLSKPISIIPFYLRTDIIIGGVIIVILSIVLLVFTTGAGSLQIFRKK